MSGLNPGQPKHCGLEVVSGRHMPEEWQGHLLTADYRANRINRFVLSDEGSGYTSRQVSDLISSDHVSFRPVDIRMGSDGAIYVADRYNPIIQHGEVDFRDPRRDHDHGRIWQITAKGRPLVTVPRLADASVEELLEQLKSQEGWTREQARRLIKERGADDVDVAPALEARVEGLAGAAPERDLHRLQALWVFQALDEAREPLLGVVLAAQDFRVRAAGVRVLSDWWDQLDHSRQLLAGAEGPDLTGPSKLANVFDFRDLARELIDPVAFAYMDEGGKDEISLKENRLAFRRIMLRPRFLTDVHEIDVSTELLGREMDLPVYICPAGGKNCFRIGGEEEAARGADLADAMYIGNGGIEESLARGEGPHHW